MKNTTTLNIAVLGSGKGSNFVALHRSIQQDGLPANVVLVASDFEDAGIIQYARAQQLPVYTCPKSKYKTRLEPEIESALAQALLDAGTQLVVLAGFMRVIKTPLLDAFPGKIINIHPSLLPKYKGMKAWEQALEAGETKTGCTVHWVDASLDGGPIIAQKIVPILPGDSPASLHARIQEQEHILLPEMIRKIAGQYPLD